MKGKPNSGSSVAEESNLIILFNLAKPQIRRPAEATHWSPTAASARKQSRRHAGLTGRRPATVRSGKQPAPEHGRPGQRVGLGRTPRNSNPAASCRTRLGRREPAAMLLALGELAAPRPLTGALRRPSIERRCQHETTRARHDSWATRHRPSVSGRHILRQHVSSASSWQGGKAWPHLQPRPMSMALEQSGLPTSSIGRNGAHEPCSQSWEACDNQRLGCVHHGRVLCGVDALPEGAPSLRGRPLADEPGHHPNRMTQDTQSAARA